MRRYIVGCVLLGLFGCKFPELPLIDETGDGGPDADLNNPQPLMVSVMGEGSVSSDPAGITCGTTCMAEFDPLSTVMLTATPDASSAFEGWSGDCTGAGTCSLTMDGAKNVSARFALHGAVRWVNQTSFPNNDYVEDIAVDPDGNVVVAGTAEPAQGSDFFVAKYASADGATIWMKHFDTPSPGGYELWGAMTLDASGDVYLTGSLQGDSSTVTYAPGHTAVGDIFANILVLKLNGDDGSVVWVKQWGGSSQDRASAIAVSGGNVYVAGTTSSMPSTFDGQTINGQTGQGFLVRADAATGLAAQVRTIPATVDLNKLVADGNNVLLAGNLRNALVLGGPCSVTPTATGNDGLAVMFTGSNLGCTWAKNFGSITSGDDTFVNSAATFGGGAGWVLAGSFEGSMSGLTTNSLTSMGGFDAYAVRFALDGTHQWSFRYGSTGAETASAISTTPSGNVVFAGSFTGSMTFGAHTVSGTQNVYVTRMSSAQIPTHEWAASYGGAESDTPWGLATASDGSVYVTSSFSGMTTVGEESLAAQQIDDWVAALVR